MKKTFTAFEARTNLGEIMNNVYYKNDEVIIKKRGIPFVKITRITEPHKEKSISKFKGLWEDDSNIEKNMKKFKKNFKLFK